MIQRAPGQVAIRLCRSRSPTTIRFSFRRFHILIQVWCLAHTQLTYGDQYPLLDYSLIPDTTAGYGFVFGTVTESPCGFVTGTAMPATGILSIHALTAGTNDFTIMVDGTIYAGTLTVTGNQCIISWNYTSGVTISPLSITKQ